MRLIRIQTFHLAILATFLTIACPPAHAQIESVSLGIRGNCKLGYWVPAKIKCKGQLPDTVVVEVSLPDTDGIRTTFIDEKPTIRSIGETTFVETMVKLGRTKGVVEVKLFTKQGEGSSRKQAQVKDSEFLHEGSYRIAQVCTPLDALLELYVSLGKSVEIKGASTIGGINEYAPSSSIAIETEELFQDVPFGSHWKSLESIDGLIIEAGSFVETPLPYAIQTAIAGWVKSGGNLAITGGPKLKEFFEKNPELQSLFKGDVLGTRRLASTTAIERAVKASESVSGQRNRPFVAICRNVAGQVVIREGDDPVLIKQAIGFGQLVVVTVNLAEEPFAEWSDRKSFSGLVISQLNFQAEIRRNQEQRATRFGFEDLSGQLRSALDDFGGVSSVNFTVVAAIAILFICLIGPADYFLLKKFARRMELTWISFSLIVVLICVLTYWIHTSTKASELLCRQVEVVDIDTENQIARGSLWTHVYSPSSQKYEMRWAPQKGIASSVQYGSWFGFPGEALGGMDNQSLNTSSSARYEVKVHSSELGQLPINVASTKGLQMDWVGSCQLSDSGSPTLVRNTLGGRVSNPLDVELENVFVVHKRSIYQFKGKLGPGDSFDIEEDTKERSLADYLNLRKVKDLGTEATPWSITDTNLRRILEIMMFYEGSGGRGYVNLFQRYLNRIDFSYSVGEDRIILVGRSRKPANRLIVDEKELDKEYEESWTYYRILIPVQASK